MLICRLRHVAASLILPGPSMCAVNIVVLPSVLQNKLKPCLRQIQPSVGVEPLDKFYSSQNKKQTTQSTNTIGQGIQKFLLKNLFLCIAWCMLKVPAKMLVIREASCVTNDKASTPKSRSSRIHLTVFAVSAESAKSSRSSNLLSGTSPTCKTIGIRRSLFSCRVHPDQCHIIA